MTETVLPYEPDGLASLALVAAAIVALLWGAVWALRRARPHADIWGRGDCKIVRSLALGPRERLVVVRIGAKHLVVGVGSATVSLLCELDEALPPVASPNARFGEAVRKAMERWHGG